MVSTSIRKSEDIGISLEELRESAEARTLFLKSCRPDLWLNYPPYPEFMEILILEKLSAETIKQRKKILRSYCGYSPIERNVIWDYYAEFLWKKLTPEHRFKFLQLKNIDYKCSDSSCLCSAKDWSKLTWDELREIRWQYLSWVDYTNENNRLKLFTHLPDYYIYEKKDDEQSLLYVKHVPGEERLLRANDPNWINKHFSYDGVNYRTMISREHHELLTGGEYIICQSTYDSITFIISETVRYIFDLKIPINRQKSWELPGNMNTKDEPYETWAARWSIEKMEQSK